MTSPELDALKEALRVAEADVVRLRAENGALADAFRAEPTDAGKAGLRRGAEALAGARDRVDAARAALQVFEKTGTSHGIVAQSGRAFGTVAVDLPPGTSQREREKRVDAALGDPLAAAAAELGVVLASSPERYTRERPGRDAQGRTILEVAGRVEGDVLVPAVSKAAKKAARD